MPKYIEIVDVNTKPFSNVIELKVRFKTILIDSENIQNTEVETTRKKLFITKSRSHIYVDINCTRKCKIPPKIIYFGGESPIEKPEEIGRYDLFIQELKNLLGAKWLKAYMCL